MKLWLNILKNIIKFQPSITYQEGFIEVNTTVLQASKYVFSGILQASKLTFRIFQEKGVHLLATCMVNYKSGKAFATFFQYLTSPQN